MTPSLQIAVEAFKSEYTQALRERPEDVRSVDELDEAIQQARVEMGTFAMEASIAAAVELGVQADRACSCGGHCTIHHRPRLEVQSMQGKYGVDGVSLRCDRCGATQRPVHDRLEIGEFSKTTQRFDRLSADFFLDKGAPTAVRRMQEHHGIEPGRTTVLRRAEKRGHEARAFLDAKLAQATQEAESRRAQRARVDTVFVQMDSSSGKTVQPLQRPEVAPDADVERTPVRGLPKVKRPVEGRQVKLLCAQANGEVDWVYDAYVGEYDDAPDKLLGLAATRRWQDGVMAVMTADGDEKIREMGEAAFLPDFQFILDHPHALQHLRAVTTYGGDAVEEPAAEWQSKALEQMSAGGVSKVVADILNIADRVVDDDPKEPNRTKVSNAAAYFKERVDAVRYDEFRDKGWPLASGAVEGGHIHFIHPITKRGSGWRVENLNATVALACVRQSGWWDEFWALPAAAAA